MDGLPVILRGEETRDGMPLVVRHQRRHGGAVIAMMVGALGGWIIMTIGMGLSPEAKGTMRYRNANANQNNTNPRAATGILAALKISGLQARKLVPTNIVQTVAQRQPMPVGVCR